MAKTTDKSFEENLTELEEIVRKLENGDVPLEDAISEFQKGMILSDELKKTLADAEKTLVKIVKKDGSVEEFDGE